VLPGIHHNSVLCAIVKSKPVVLARCKCRTWPYEFSSSSTLVGFSLPLANTFTFCYYHIPLRANIGGWIERPSVLIDDESDSTHDTRGSRSFFSW
jgi:hypothetical protein